MDIAFFFYLQMSKIILWILQKKNIQVFDDAHELCSRRFSTRAPVVGHVSAQASYTHAPCWHTSNPCEVEIASWPLYPGSKIGRFESPRGINQSEIRDTENNRVEWNVWWVTYGMDSLLVSAAWHLKRRWDRGAKMPPNGRQQGLTSAGLSAGSSRAKWAAKY